MYVCTVYISAVETVTGEQKKAHRYNGGSRRNTSVIVLLITHIVMVVRRT